MNKLTNALNTMGAYPYQCKSSYADSDAQSNLYGRTHYVDASSLKYFKANILRGKHSANGLFYVLQESLPHPDHGGARVRRNVVFDIFGDVVTESREMCHTNSAKADAHYYELMKWTNSRAAVKTIREALNAKIKREALRIKQARAALRGLK